MISLNVKLIVYIEVHGSQRVQSKWGSMVKGII